jgi:hypothetical protein
MKKIILVLLLISCRLYSNDQKVTPQVPTQLQQFEFNDFEAMTDEMIKHDAGAEKIEIKEPSGFQMFLRRVGGPIVMAYVRMREKMSSFWTWLTTPKKRTIHH